MIYVHFFRKFSRKSKYPKEDSVDDDNATLDSTHSLKEVREVHKPNFEIVLNTRGEMGRLIVFEEDKTLCREYRKCNYDQWACLYCPTRKPKRSTVCGRLIREIFYAPIHHYCIARPY